MPKKFSPSVIIFLFYLHKKYIRFAMGQTHITLPLTKHIFRLPENVHATLIINQNTYSNKDQTQNNHKQWKQL